MNSADDFWASDAERISEEPNKAPQGETWALYTLAKVWELDQVQKLHDAPPHTARLNATMADGQRGTDFVPDLAFTNATWRRRQVSGVARRKIVQPLQPDGDLPQRSAARIRNLAGSRGVGFGLGYGEFAHSDAQTREEIKSADEAVPTDLPRARVQTSPQQRHLWETAIGLSDLEILQERDDDLVIGSGTLAVRAGQSNPVISTDILREPSESNIGLELPIGGGPYELVSVSDRASVTLRPSRHGNRSPRHPVPRRKWAARTAADRPSAYRAAGVAVRDVRMSIPAATSRNGGGL